MRNFQCLLLMLKRSYISYCIIFMTVPLKVLVFGSVPLSFWGFYYIIDAIDLLIYLFPMHPFSAPSKHQKTVFCCFQGVEKGCIGNKWVNVAVFFKKVIGSYVNIVQFTNIFFRIYTAQKWSCIKDFFSKCDKIRSFLQFWSHLLLRDP